MGAYNWAVPVRKLVKPVSSGASSENLTLYAGLWIHVDGRIPAIPLNLPLLKGCSLVGVFWGAQTRKEPDVHVANLQALFRLFNEGKIKPHVTELDGLDRFTEALDLLNGRRSTCKVVIRVASGEG